MFSQTSFAVEPICYGGGAAARRPLSQQQLLLLRSKSIRLSSLFLLSPLRTLHSISSLSLCNNLRLTILPGRLRVCNKRLGSPPSPRPRSRFSRHYSSTSSPPPPPSSSFSHAADARTTATTAATTTIYYRPIMYRPERRGGG